MQKSKFILIPIFLLLAVTLSACSGAIPDKSWPESLVVDKTIYTASGSFVHGVNAETGKELNPKQFPEKAEGGMAFGAAPVLMGDQLLVGDYASHLRLLSSDLKSESKSVKDATGRFISSPTITEDKILVANADHNLYAYDKDLNLKWKFQAKNSIWTRPVVYEDMIFVASLDKYVYALRENDSKDGSDVVWSKDLGGAVFLSLAIDEKGNLYIGTLNNEIFSIDTKTGKINWQVKTSGTVWSPLVIKDERLYGGDQSGKIFALNKNDGSMVWEYEAGSPVIGSVTLYDDRLFAGTQNGEALSIAIADEPKSRLLWTQNVGGKLYSTPVLTDKYVVFGSYESDKTLVAYKFNGDAGWTFTPSK